MKINGSTALITGANRGLGRAFAQVLLERGAVKVYATARRPETIDLPGVEIIALDVTNPRQIVAAAEAAGDVDLLVNNAGVGFGGRLVDGDPEDLSVFRAELETNLLGPLALVRAFAPALAANGGGAVLNVLSAHSWFPMEGTNGYHVTKAAAWAMTGAVRVELASQGTQVTGVHLGMVDTDMIAGWPGAKLSPREAVTSALDGLEAGRSEILADDFSRQIKAGLIEDPEVFYPRVATLLSEVMAG